MNTSKLLTTQSLSLGIRATLLLICFSAHALWAEDASDYLDKARKLTEKYLIVDTHIDVPYRLQNHWQDVTAATDGGDFDYPRAVAGGLNAPFMSIYVPASLEQEGGGHELANRLIDHVEAMAARAPDQFALATRADDLGKHQKQGRISLVMGMENGTPIEGKLENLDFFYQRGIRYITLAHSKSNHISDSSYDENRQWNGLSPFGRQVVAEMNRLGMMIDVSHLTDDAARQAIELSTVPVIASHSSVRKFTADWERNMDDNLIRLMADRGGVIHINFGSAFIAQRSLDWGMAQREAAAAYREAEGLAEDAAELKGFAAGYRQANPYPYATVPEVADHIDHVVALVGIDHVGIGSDYDGVGDSLPTGLKSVADYPNLVAELLRRDYSEKNIEKLLGGNLIRVWKAVEDAADQ